MENNANTNIRWHEMVKDPLHTHTHIHTTNYSHSLNFTLKKWESDRERELFRIIFKLINEQID